MPESFEGRKEGGREVLKRVKEADGRSCCLMG